jgi:hypothetical protein
MLGRELYKTLGTALEEIRPDQYRHINWPQNALRVEAPPSTQTLHERRGPPVANAGRPIKGCPASCLLNPTMADGAFSNRHVVGGAFGGAAATFVVDLGSGDVAVTKEVLNLADIHTGVEKQRGCGRPQGVRGID